MKRVNECKFNLHEYKFFPAFFYTVFIFFVRYTFSTVLLHNAMSKEQSKNDKFLGSISFFILRLVL